MPLKRVCLAVCVGVATVLLTGCGDPGWVQVSPNGDYVTVVRKPPDAPANSEELELELHHIDRRTTTPIFRFSRDEKSSNAGWVYNVQWTPDSRALCFSWLPFESPDAEGSSAANDARPTETVQPTEFQPRLMLYEVASGQLTQLPISVHAPRWSPDGRLLIGVGEEDTLCIYRTDTWNCTQRIPISEGEFTGVVVWEWAHWLQTTPPKAVVHLGVMSDEPLLARRARRGNLFILHKEQLMPLTTSGDVQAFWVDRTGVVVRWVRVQHKKFLAVYERPLQGTAARRIALIPHTVLPADAHPDTTYYRFSPDGQKLAWYTEDNFYVLEIATGVVHTLNARALPDTKIEVLFDWRDSETLVVQRGLGLLETHTVRTLYP